MISVVSVGFQVLFFAVGVALVGGGAAALAGKLPGNSWFGVRTPETRESPEAWRLANRTGGIGFVAAGFGLLASGLSLLTMSGALAVVFSVLGAVFAVAMLAYGGLMGAKAAAVWRDRAEAEGTLPEALQPFGTAAGESCCGGAPAEDASDAVSCGDSGCGTPAGAAASAGVTGSAEADPATDCGVTGGCGSCSLHGSCAPLASAADRAKATESR